MSKYYVAVGHALTSRSGIRSGPEGTGEITADMFAGGEETLQRMLKSGAVIEASKDPYAGPAAPPPPEPPSPGKNEVSEKKRKRSRAAGDPSDGSAPAQQGERPTGGAQRAKE